MSCQPFAFFCRSVIRSCRPGSQEKQFRHVPNAGADLDCRPFSAPLLPCLPAGLPTVPSLPKIPARNSGHFFPCAHVFRQALVASSAGDQLRFGSPARSSCLFRFLERFRIAVPGNAQR